MSDLEFQSKMASLKRCGYWNALLFFSLVCLQSLILTSCATPELASPKVAIIQTQTFAGDSNVYVDAENEATLIQGGIPPSYFAWSDQRNLFFMTRIQAIEATNIRAAKRNPAVWNNP